MVGERGGDAGDRGEEVRHDEDGVDAAVADERDDGFHHGPVAEVDVHVRCGGKGDGVGGHCGELGLKNFGGLLKVDDRCKNSSDT